MTAGAVTLPAGAAALPAGAAALPAGAAAMPAGAATTHGVAVIRLPRVVLARLGRRVVAVARGQGRVSGSGRGDGGSAIVEFVFLAVLMLVPLFYLVMVLARLQAGAYAVSAASREAGRAYVTASTAAQAPARAQAAAGLAFSDQGFERLGAIDIGCDGSPCLRPEGRVDVTAKVSVPLPLVPSFFASLIPTSIPISATHVATVDRFDAR